MVMLRFTRWEIPSGTSLSAVVPGAAHLCGIYVLEFADGELYVGQTVSLLTRFADHARRWPGEIVALRFAALVPEELNTAERDVIARLVSHGGHLRNTDLVALPLRSAALDSMVDTAVQAAWLAGDCADLSIGERGQEALQRRRTHARYSLLASRDDFEQIVAILGEYLRICVPWPHQTERRFWTVTSLPGTGRSSDWHRLVTLNINNIEVLMLGEGRQRGANEWQATGFINVAHTKNLDSVRGLRLERASYGPVGDIRRLRFEHWGAVSRLFGSEVVTEAARELAMGLLRKGSGMFGRFHDYNLADDVFGYLESTYGGS
ncbi:MAG: GIY-YIG nuclease family protein [Arachnia sp.]